jgi:SOS response regulatory protein OraA/RecX
MRSRSGPRKLATDEQLYASAVRALMRRAYAIHEMRKYLERRTEDKEAVSTVVARLREQQYLDDARYALEYVRHHAQTRRQGRFRIARELRGRGVPDRHIEAALDSIFAETICRTLAAHSARTRLPRSIAACFAPAFPQTSFEPNCAASPTALFRNSRTLLIPNSKRRPNEIFLASHAYK